MKFFYRDRLANIQISWDEFVQDINEAVFFPKFVYTNNFYEIFKYCTLAILNEVEITLLDGGFSNVEIKKLTGSTIENLLQKKHKSTARFGGIKEFLSVLKLKDEGEIILYTSGTTGKPKAVKHKIKKLKSSIIVSPDKRDNIWGFCFHPTHIAGLQVFLQALFNGNSIVRLFGLDSRLIEQEINDFRITNISATPTFFRLFSPVCSLQSVTRVTSGGEKFDEWLKNKIKTIFPNAKIRNIYASTEFGTLFISDDDFFEVKSEHAKLVKICENELFVHVSLLGSFKDISVSTNIKSNEGEWYGTGDLVEIIQWDPLRFRFVGRKSEMINVGGMKVNPNEVEEAIRNIAKVEYVKVYGKKNSVVGNVVCCDIVAKDELLDEKMLREKLRQVLQDYKIPRLFRFVDKIDLTRTGKIARNG